MRVSASDIDAFRRYRSDEDSELGPLLAQLRRELPPTEAMAAGSAFHKALEHANCGEFGILEADGYWFEFAIEAEIDLPDVRELKATREYVIDGEPVTLVGVVDAMHGKRIDDHKTTTRFDPDRYLSSYQWRVYLEIFGADTFRWNVFEWRETEPKTYAAHAFHQLHANRYPGMADDLLRELTALVDFARIHLPERITHPKETA